MLGVHNLLAALSVAQSRFLRAAQVLVMLQGSQSLQKFVQQKGQGQSHPCCQLNHDLSS